MRVPFIYTSPRVFVNQADRFDNERGVSFQEVGGEHSIWAARVPFLPAMMSDDFTRLGNERIPLVMKRQYRFIYDLARAREHRATFELRFIATPNPVPGEPNLIDLVFLGKAFSARQGAARAFAERLWYKFTSNFPLEDPFNYPLEPVTDEAEFWSYYEPIPFHAIEQKKVFEIRKYEDMPIRSMAPMGRVERKGDYIAHPFVANTDFVSPMGRFLTALATEPQPCYVGIILRPTRMFDQEIYNVSFAIGQFKRTATEDDDVTEEYIRTRSLIGVYVYQQLMLEREQLVMVRVHVVGRDRAPYGVAEALGSEMMGNAENKYPTQWATVQPADECEMSAALNNLQYLEHDFWGYTIAAPPLRRLRYLATAQEAYGAFRLPIPPESGYIPGILVKEEPFVSPADALELRLQARANLDNVQERVEQRQEEKRIALGEIYHRGNRTPQSFTTSIRDLTRHTLIAGSTGSGKTTTILYLISQLWSTYCVPFLVLYPIDKPDYRLLYKYQGLADDLFIFTLGDESTAPFRFNPFEVPEGLLIKTHLSRLMRVFTAAFTLHDPLPMIYREALRQVYRQKGWNPISDRGDSSREYPIMSEFYDVIKRITDSLNYGQEVQDNVRQASVIRIGDLLENAGYVVNVRRSMSFKTILNRPTVMEIGRVGSSQDTSLLMGFLLMRFAEEVERNPRPSDQPHITVVEEAHRLMADTAPSLPWTGNPQSAAGEDFGNILAEVRGYGEGIIIAEQIPTLLVKGAIGNTYLKMMHWLEDVPSFELFANITNLNDRQREYARTLNAGHAIVRSPYGRPVHIKVPELEDHPGYDEDGEAIGSDEKIRSFMIVQCEKAGLEDVPVVEWEAGLQAMSSSRQTEAQSGWSTIHKAASLMMRAPLRTCAYCRPMHLDESCPHKKIVRNLMSDPTFYSQQLVKVRSASEIEEPDARWHLLSEVGHAVEESVRLAESKTRKEIAYCFFAHLAGHMFEDIKGNTVEEKKQRGYYRTTLYDFDKRYISKGDENG